MIWNKRPRAPEPLFSYPRDGGRGQQGCWEYEGQQYARRTGHRPSLRELRWASLTLLDVTLRCRAALQPAVPLVVEQLLLPARQVRLPRDSIQVKDACVGGRAGARLRGHGLPAALLQVRGGGPALFSLVPGRRRRRKDAGRAALPGAREEVVMQLCIPRWVTRAQG